MKIRRISVIKKWFVTALFILFSFTLLTEFMPLSAQDAHPCGSCGMMLGSIQKCEGRSADIRGNASGNCIVVQDFVVLEQNNTVPLHCTDTQFYNCTQTSAPAGCPLGASGCGRQ